MFVIISAIISCYILVQVAHDFVKLARLYVNDEEPTTDIFLIGDCLYHWSDNDEFSILHRSRDWEYNHRDTKRHVKKFVQWEGMWSLVKSTAGSICVAVFNSLVAVLAIALFSIAWPILLPICGPLLLVYLIKRYKTRNQKSQE